MWGCQRVSVLFFSLTEAVGWQSRSWWWQLNDLFFIKHLLLSVYRSLTTSLPPCLQCLILSFDWFLSLSSPSNSSEPLSARNLHHCISPPLVSLLLLPPSLLSPAFFSVRAARICLHPSHETFSESACHSASLFDSSSASQSVIVLQGFKH